MRRQLVCLPRLHLWFIDSHLASPQARLVAGHDRSGGGATEVNVVDTRSAGHSAADGGNSSVSSPSLRAFLKRQDPGKRPSVLPITATLCTPGLLWMRGRQECPKLKTSYKHHTLQARPSYYCWVLKQSFSLGPDYLASGQRARICTCSITIFGGSGI